MDDYMWNYHVPAFGSWDYGNDNMPYTQCFETARTQQEVSYGRFGGYNETTTFQDQDLYVAGDLYQNDFLTPAVILVPRSRRKGERGYSNVKGVKKQQQERKQKQEEWKGYSYDIKEPPSPIISPPNKQSLKSKSKSKPVDEDLYKIPPEYLHVKPKRKKGFGLFSSCLLPACA